MLREWQEFQIRLKVRDKDGKIKELSKKANLEIYWENNKGILNPSELRNFTDDYGKQHSYRKSKGEVVEFEKDGKKYNILVKINEIEKGWFKDKIKEFGGFSPILGSDFTIIGNENKKGKPTNSRSRSFWEENKDWEIKPTERNRGGFLLVGWIVFFLLLVIIIVFYYYRNKLYRYGLSSR